mmetsp:Transcript_52312/g.94129  ORF Transcript_52312/g.94129 Transcript_52312/m.94129 type:complete len:226 (-) Transcript_52312:8-685(-)
MRQRTRNVHHNLSNSRRSGTSTLQTVQDLHGIEAQGVLQIPLGKDKDVVEEVVWREISPISILDSSLGNADDARSKGVNDEAYPEPGDNVVKVESFLLLLLWGHLQLVLLLGHREGHLEHCIVDVLPTLCSLGLLASSRFGSHGRSSPLQKLLVSVGEPQSRRALHKSGCQRLKPANGAYGADSQKEDQAAASALDSHFDERKPESAVGFLFAPSAHNPFKLEPT